MRAMTLVASLLFPYLALGADLTETAQFTLRFKDARPHPSALTGCYGTASYAYQLPSVETLKTYRETLADQAKQQKLAGFAFSSERDPKDGTQALVVDLANGDVKSIPRHTDFANNRGLVFCQCKKTYLKHCAHGNLPALGHPFEATAKVKPSPVGVTWEDPLTTIRWTYRSPGMNWKKAKAACAADGKRLPSLEELQVAQRRLVNSPAGKAALKAGDLVWTATPGKDVVPQAWAMWLTTGNARWAMVQNPLPVICAEGTAP